MVEDARSGWLVAWGNALLMGRVSPDEAVERITAGDEPHRVAGLPGEEGGPVGLSLAFGRLRLAGARGLRLALPVPGDPLGLPGPPVFNDAALDAGEAAITVGGPVAYGLVPYVSAFGPAGDRGVSVLWRVYEVADRPPSGPFLAEAERGLNDALREAVAELTRQDVAGSGPAARAAADALRARAEAGGPPLAPGYPGRAVRVLELARRVRGIREAAATTHGGAVTAAEMAARAGALRPLERACRRALVAAHDAVLEPGRT
jgi:hypothetical protein